MMKKFSLVQKIRNKIKIKGSLDINISKSAKLVGCEIEVKGNNNSLRIDDSSTIRNTNIEIVGDNCSVTIGKDCIVGDNCYISAKDGTELTIKNGCMLSRNIKIMTSDGHPIYQEGEIINSAKSITLQESVWVSDNVTILKSVSVGSGSIIGINSTLTKSVESNVIAVGNPAKIVKTGVNWKN